MFGKLFLQDRGGPGVSRVGLVGLSPRLSPTRARSASRGAGARWICSWRLDAGDAATAADSSIDHLNFPAQHRAGRERLPVTLLKAFSVVRAVRDSIWESTGSSLQSRKAPEAMSMSDQDDWEFAGQMTDNLPKRAPNQLAKSIIDIRERPMRTTNTR
jgi:hypothetical protein